MLRKGFSKKNMTSKLKNFVKDSVKNSVKDYVKNSVKDYVKNLVVKKVVVKTCETPQNKLFEIITRIVKEIENQVINQDFESIKSTSKQMCEVINMLTKIRHLSLQFSNVTEQREAFVKDSNKSGCSNSFLLNETFSGKMSPGSKHDTVRDIIQNENNQVLFYLRQRALRHKNIIVAKSQKLSITENKAHRKQGTQRTRHIENKTHREQDT